MKDCIEYDATLRAAADYLPNVKEDLRYTYSGYIMERRLQALARLKGHLAAMTALVDLAQEAAEEWKRMEDET